MAPHYFSLYILCSKYMNKHIYDINITIAPSRWTMIQKTMALLCNGEFVLAYTLLRFPLVCRIQQDKYCYGFAFIAIGSQWLPMRSVAGEISTFSKRSQSCNLQKQLYAVLLILQTIKILCPALSNLTQSGVEISTNWHFQLRKCTKSAIIDLTLRNT